MFTEYKDFSQQRLVCEHFVLNKHHLNTLKIIFRNIDTIEQKLITEEHVSQTLSNRQRINEAPDEFEWFN